MRFRTWWIPISVCLGVGGLAIISGGAISSLPVQNAELVNAFPHDPGSFTQGLVVQGETVYEGTGHYGKSKLRKLDLRTGTVQQEVDLHQSFFGEGITIYKGRIYQLTWKEGACLVYDQTNMQSLGTLKYSGEGWGLTHDGQYLYLSNGTSTVRVLDPNTLREVRQFSVREGRRFLTMVNELEYHNGEILANIWYSDRIARIDPKSGKVNGWIECGHLYPASQRPREHVLNGIAVDSVNKRMFVTGKNWPKLFEIKLPASSW
jgi:glutamine cyclotransferase